MRQYWITDLAERLRIPLAGDKFASESDWHLHAGWLNTPATAKARS